MLSQYIPLLCVLALIAIPFLYWFRNRPFGSNSPWQIFSEKEDHSNGGLYQFTLVRTKRLHTKHARTVGRLIVEAKKKGLRSPNLEEFDVFTKVNDLIPGYWYVNIKERVEFSGSDKQTRDGSRPVTSIESVPMGDGIIYVFVPDK